MTLLNYQSSFNGLTWGAGTDVQLAGQDGLRGMPSVRQGDVPRARRNGSFPGLNFFDERVTTWKLQVFNTAIATPGRTVEQVLASIAAACENIEDPSAQLPLATQLPGWAEPRILFCRPTAMSEPVDDNYQYNAPYVTIEFTASDPLIYGNTLKTAAATLPSPTAGLTFPVTFNVSFGSSTGGSFQTVNNGSYQTPPVFTIAGPVTNPIITLTSTGEFFGLNLSLTATDHLVIDMNAETVILNGTASRWNAVMTGSTWFALPPGTSSVGVQSTDATPVAAVFSAAYRDAWGNM